MNPVEIFCWGFVGSAAVDVFAAAKFYEASQIKFPERYGRISYYIVRGIVALIAGGLAVAYEIDKAILAINIGAATPLIIQAFSQGLSGYQLPPGEVLDLSAQTRPAQTLPSPETPNT